MDWTEFEKRRNENLAKRLLETKEEILVHIDKRIRELPAHKTAPQTLVEIQRLKDSDSEQKEKINIMACQVEAMYTVFTSTNFVLRATIRVFGAIGIITGAIIGVIELMKRKSG